MKSSTKQRQHWNIPKSKSFIILKTPHLLWGWVFTLGCATLSILECSVCVFCVSHHKCSPQICAMIRNIFRKTNYWSRVERKVISKARGIGTFYIMRAHSPHTIFYLIYLCIEAYCLKRNNNWKNKFSSWKTYKKYANCET